MLNKGGRPKGFKLSNETKLKISESMKGNANAKGKKWKSRKTQENDC